MAETLTRFPANPVGKVFKSCPNGALIYSGFRSINYVAIFENQNPTVECFYTRQPINEISVDPKWPIDDGVNSRRYFSVLFEDNIVQVWDFEKGCPLYGHKAHVQQSHVEGKGDKFKIVLMDFMSNSNLMTLDSQDVIVLCCSSQNYIKRRNFLNLRSDKLLSLSCSQFNANIFAVGTIRGVVYVCDVQKSAVIHALRGHRETAISSIVWHCFSQNTSKEQETDDDKVLDMSVNKDLNNECKQLANAKSDDIFSHCFSQNASKKQDPDDGEVLDTHINKDINNDCEQLAITKSDDCFSQEEELNKDEQCQSSEKNIAHNKSLSSDESLATICSSSDDEIAVEGDPNLLKTKVLYKAQVHASLGGSDKSNQSIDKVGITPEDTVEIEEPKDNISKSKEFADESDYDLIKKHIMLTSVSAYNGTYCVWNFENGKLCDSIKTPGQILNPKRQLSVNWKNEHTIIGISKEGEIMSWTCDPPTYDDQNSNISLKFTKDKQLNLNFAADAICYDNNKEIIWCRGGSRQIICFDLVTKKVLASFNTVCNGIYDIKECPDDMNKILLGFCDHSFGLLDIVKLSPTNINIQSLCRADLVVNCITWSPDCLSFAYGTNEGTVGVVNVDNKKHIFQTNSVGNKPIYTLDWETENCLYINYKDKIAMMDLKSKTKDVYTIPEMGNASCISFRGYFAFCGTQTGYLQMFRMASPTRFVFIKSIKVLSRYISRISWSPIVTDRFAVVGSNKEIHVFSFDEKSMELMKIHTLSVDNLQNQFSDIKWSNSDGDRFVTCSLSGEVRVWDMKEQNNKLITTKVFNCPIRCAMFLPTDENIVLCCGKNLSLETFDIRSNSVLSTLNKRVSSIDNILWATKASTVMPKRKKNTGLKSEEMQSTINMEDNNEDHINDNNLDLEGNREENTAKTVDETKERVQSITAVREKEPTTVLYMIGKEINRNANQILLNILDKRSQKERNDDTSLCAKLFGSKDDLQEIFNAELNQIKMSGVTGTNLGIIPCLTGNIKEYIVKQAEAKKLTEWHLMMAPKISIRFWEKCMNAFALQLKDEGKPLYSACTYIGINKISEAIKILYDRNLFRESFLVARLYLEPDDPKIIKIFEDWVLYLDLTGNFSGASLLCLLSGEKKRAYDLICKIRQRDEHIEHIINMFSNTSI